MIVKTDCETSGLAAVLSQISTLHTVLVADNFAASHVTYPGEKWILGLQMEAVILTNDMHRNID